jgi:uncharacterized protein (TIGR00661 family)
MSLMKSLVGGIRFRLELDRYVAPLARMIRDEDPDLILTDFEPLLPRAAVRCGRSYLSVDHQHFLLTYDLSSLPRRLRQYAGMMRRVVPLFHRWQSHSIVSAFFFPPLIAAASEATQAGILLRDEVLRATPGEGRFVLAYLRPRISDRALDALSRSGNEVHVYGLGERPADGRLRFHRIDEAPFVDHLAHCACLVAGAGNQLLGEALYLGKPVLAIPESRHHEQRINAHYLQSMGAGRWVFLEDLATGDVRDFRADLDRFRANLQGIRPRLDGLETAMAVIERFLPHKVATHGEPAACTLK